MTKLPRDISVDGHRIDALLHVSLTLLGALALILFVWFVWLLVRGWRRSLPTTGGRHPALVPLAITAGFFFGIDGYLFFRSAADREPLFATETAGDPLAVEVNAHQWAWEFRYAGPDGRFATPDDIVGTNQLRVPLGRRVELQLGSSDVVHAFHLPNLRIKRDVIPGHIRRAGFTATALGTFEVACAQFCGVQHYRMRGTLMVLEPNAFAAWEKQASQDSLRIQAELARAAAAGETAQPPSFFPRAAPARSPRDWGWPWR